MYVIDGMMHNTIVKSDMHAVDTHGVTLLTFAAMHFLEAVAKFLMPSDSVTVESC